MSVSTIGGRSTHSWTTVLDGTRLRKLRWERGLSQEQLAERAGISLRTVARLNVSPGHRAVAGRSPG